MKKTAQEPKVTENSLYHDTWMLLRKYRDVVWSLELSVQQVRRQFQIEYGSSIEEFLESLYVAGITFEGSAIEDHARCIERSYKMLKLLDTSVELLRTKHKYGESYHSYGIIFSFCNRPTTIPGAIPIFFAKVIIASLLLQSVWIKAL